MPCVHYNLTFSCSSGLEEGSPSLPDFYKPDELKYHGRRNRGVTRVNFYDEVKQSIGSDAGQKLGFCGGEWKYPRACDPEKKECEYLARWKYDENTDLVDFVVQSSHTDKWTGIGFSKTPRMKETDVVVGYVEPNGRAYLKYGLRRFTYYIRTVHNKNLFFDFRDMWNTNYIHPLVDNSQDLKNKQGSNEDGLVTLKFSRKRDTGDRSRDVAFTDDESIYLMFPVQGGNFNAVTKKMKKHEQTPTVSAEKVFIKACRNGKRYRFHLMQRFTLVHNFFVLFSRWHPDLHYNPETCPSDVRSQVEIC